MKFSWESNWDGLERPPESALGGEGAHGQTRVIPIGQACLSAGRENEE
jgi:hypothetical protein